MSFNNNANNANLHTPSPTNHGPKKPTFLEVVLSVEEDPSVWANRWGYFKRSDRIVASSEGVQAETGFGTRSCSPFDERDHIYESADSMSPAPSHAAPVTETYHPRYSQGHQLTTNWPTQLYYPVTMDRVTNTVALGALDPIRVPMDYWQEEDGNGSSVSTVQTNTQSPHRLRTRMMPALRYLPCVLPHTRFVQYGNAEPEPATPVSLPPHPTQQDMSHSGGTSEISANAEKQQTTTEKEAVPRKKTRLPRGAGRPRKYCVQQSNDMRRLRNWATKWRNLHRLVSQKGALETALGVIQGRRMPVYSEPHLKTATSERTAVGSRIADIEHEKRKVLRRTREDLSRYYQLQGTEKSWTVSTLIPEVLKEVLSLPKPSLEPPPQSSTSTGARENRQRISQTARVSVEGHPICTIDKSGDDLEDTAEVSDGESIGEATEDLDEWKT